jgi:hypothetical protein
LRGGGLFIDLSNLMPAGKHLQWFLACNIIFPP